MASFNGPSAKQAIEDKGLTVTFVAQEMDPPMSRAVLSNILNGNRKGGVDLAVRIARVLGDDPYAFLGPDNPRAAVIELARELGVTAEELAS